MKTVGVYIGLMHMIALNDVTDGLQMSGCNWPVFNGVWNYENYGPSPHETHYTKDFGSYIATLSHDNTTYSNGNWWVIGWGSERDGNVHEMACSAPDYSDLWNCGTDHWWYWHNGWHRDPDCQVVNSSVGASTGSSDTVNADDHGPVPIDSTHSTEDSHSFDELIPLIIGSAVGTLVIVAVLAFLVVTKVIDCMGTNMSESSHSEENEVEMAELVDASEVTAEAGAPTVNVETV